MEALISSCPRSRNTDQPFLFSFFCEWVPIVNPITRLACNYCWGVRGAPARGFGLSARVHACVYVCMRARIFQLSARFLGAKTTSKTTSVSNLESAQTQRCPGRSQTDLENVLEVLSLKNRHSLDRSLRPSGLRTSWMSKHSNLQRITCEVRELSEVQVLER